MARLDIERQNKLEPLRKKKALDELSKLLCKGKKYNNVFFEITDKLVKFYFKNEIVTLYFYSGWHTGKTIKDGRGLKKLIKQLNS